MAKINPNEAGQYEKNKRWHKRRKTQLLPDNFSALTQAEQIEALRSVVIVQARLIDVLTGDAR